MLLSFLSIKKVPVVARRKKSLPPAVDVPLLDKKTAPAAVQKKETLQLQVVANRPKEKRSQVHPHYTVLVDLEKECLPVRSVYHDC